MEGNGSSTPNESIEGFKAVRANPESPPWEDGEEALDAIEEQLAETVEEHDGTAGFIVVLRDGYPAVVSSVPEGRAELTEEEWYTLVYGKLAVQAAMTNPQALLSIASLLNAGHQLGGDPQLEATSQAIQHIQAAEMMGPVAIRSHPRRRYCDVTDERRQLLKRVELLMEPEELDDTDLAQVRSLLPDLHEFLEDLVGNRDQPVAE